MHIQQKAFSKHTDTTNKNSYTTSKQHTNNHRDTKHLFNHKAVLFTQCHKQYFDHQNTAPTTHHNTKLYIIYIMRLLCAALCTCTPTIKNTCNARKQSAHKTTPSITHHKVRPSPNPTQNKPHIHARTTTKKNHHTLQQLRPRRPAQTIHNTHKNIKNATKKQGRPPRFLLK